MTDSPHPVYFDKATIDWEVDRLHKLGYPDDLIEIYERDGSMHARPLGSAPTLEERIADLFS